MQQFFIDQPLNLKDIILLPDDIARQCRLVLRYQNGEIVRIAGQDRVVSLATLQFDASSVKAEIFEILPQSSVEGIQITLIQALIRKERWEFFLQKATEVGVHRIVPLILERNVVKWDRRDESAKIARYRKIVQEAAEQSRRSDIPIIETPVTLRELDRFRSEQNFVAYELERSKSLKNALKPCKSVSVILGSEGGISLDELSVMSQNGYIPVTLGSRILRAETAGIVVCATIDAILG